MQKVKTKLFIGAWCFIFNINCFAQSAIDFKHYNISRLTQDNGLSQCSNYFRFEDSKGFMWITANDAINRYDGSSVKVYNLNRYFKNCPSLQQGYGFAEDDKANVYIGSEKGLYTYTRSTDKFTLNKVFTKSVDDVVMPFAFENDKVWCFNRFYQLATYNVKTKEIKTEASVNLDTLSSIHIYQIINNVFYYRFPALDKEGNIWMVGKNKVAVYNIALKKTTYPVVAKKSDIQNEFFCAYYDTANLVLNIGTNNGVLQYYKQTNNIKSVSSINNIRPGLVHQITANKNVIALNTAAGLAFTDYDFKKNYWLNDKDLKKYFSYAQLSFDKSGNLWITEDGTGQIVFSFKEKLFHKIPDEKGEIPFLKTPVVANIAELPDKNILFHSQWFLNKADNGIYKFNNKEFENNFYRSVTDTLRKGNWFFTESNIRSHGIQFRNADGVFENYTEKQEEIKNSQQQDLVVLENGSVLTSFSNGLYWLNEKEKKLQIANDITAAFKINLLSNNRIAVSYLNKDMLLFKVNNDKSLTQIRNILPSVQSFYIQQNIKTNQYWAGTNRGVYLLDRNFKIQEHFDANNGLAGTNIYGLLLDDEGNAWCSHQRGLSSINATNHVVVNYDKSDGIQDWDFNNRSFYKATDGTLYFGGVNGANYFKPPLQTKAYYKPEIYIDEILVNNNIFSPDTNANQLQKISLDYKNNNISFRAVIRDLENAAYQQIIFRIKERGDVWNYLPNKGSVNLTNLAAGDYTLELGIFEKFTNSHIIQKTIRIQISAPFYFKIWFWALVAIVSTGFLFWIYNRRKLAQQTRAFQQKLALELQRNKITADLHDDIGASLSSLQLNSAVAGQLVNQDAKQAKLVLDKIENQAKNIADKIGDIIWSMKPGEDEFMTISSRIKNFANDILGATNIDYTIHIDKRADVEIKDIDSRKNIVLITKEALNNAVKYSKASKITIDLKIENHKIMLSIADDGIGFISNGTNGNGLVNMKKRAEELKGLFAIKTTEGKGTEIHCEIPL